MGPLWILTPAKGCPLAPRTVPEMLYAAGMGGDDVGKPLPQLLPDAQIGCRGVILDPRGRVRRVRDHVPRAGIVQTCEVLVRRITLLRIGVILAADEEGGPPGRQRQVGGAPIRAGIRDEAGPDVRHLVVQQSDDSGCHPAPRKPGEEDLGRIAAVVLQDANQVRLAKLGREARTPSGSVTLPLPHHIVALLAGVVV